MSIVVVPVQPAPNWSPAMDPIAVGETARCGLDARQWAARQGLTVLSVGVATDPTLSLAAAPTMVNGVCLFDLVAIDFTLLFVEDPALVKVIQARQPVRSGPPAGLTTPAVAVLPEALTDANGFLIDANGAVTSQ
jgi:hypothetical protein